MKCKFKNIPLIIDNIVSNLMVFFIILLVSIILLRIIESILTINWFIPIKVK